MCAAQYYAHPRNLFWPILGELVGAHPDLPYWARLEKLKSAGIALWDVLQSCEREGSLDSSITPLSIVPNNFADFFEGHPNIQRIFFNGAMAETAFRRHVLTTLPPMDCSYHRLPSTSPANAAFSSARRLEAWRLVTEVSNDPKSQFSST